MQSIQESNTLAEIFLPGNLARLAEVGSKNRRFAYYTTANTAMKIIENEEVWLRNATVMNDFSEIAYGLELMRRALSGPSGDSFGKAANHIFPGVMDKIFPQLSQLELHWRIETYIACLSLHEPSEDQNGRLSMWRAYGDVAVVVNNAPMTAVTDRLGVYSTPVHYLDQHGVEERLQTVAQAIAANRDFLQQFGEQVFISHTVFMVFLAAIGTKHPGFSEEKEWRIFFRPAERPDSILTSQVAVIDHVPQEIWALPLRHDPDNGLHHADVPSLLDRIIIGPTPYPYVSARAFVEILERAGVDEASRKVVVSDIPLRTRG